jgi:hypothetical protein
MITSYKDTWFAAFKCNPDFILGQNGKETHDDAINDHCCGTSDYTFCEAFLEQTLASWSIPIEPLISTFSKTMDGPCWNVSIETTDLELLIQKLLGGATCDLEST